MSACRQITCDNVPNIKDQRKVAGCGGDTDATNNTSMLVIDVYDRNDF
jgi:hypothetical protein